MQIAMETFFLPEFPDFCRKKLWQKVLCNGALIFWGSELPVCYRTAAKRVHRQRGMLSSKTGTIPACVRQPRPHV